MEVINLLPYDMHVYGNNTLRQGPQVSYPKSGRVSRLITVEMSTFHGPELWYQEIAYPVLEAVPDPEKGIFYIVPLVSAIACIDRGDLLSPYRKIRNIENLIVGCRVLQKVVHARLHAARMGDSGIN